MYLEELQTERDGERERKSSIHGFILQIAKQPRLGQVKGRDTRASF